MVDTQKVHDATWDMVSSMRDTNQAVADTWVSMQDRNMRLVQSFSENSMGIVSSNTESASRLMQTLLEQSRKQQEAFATLMRSSMDSYVNVLLTPFVFYSGALQIAERVLEGAQQASNR
jgi:hypothetical protein